MYYVLHQKITRKYLKFKKPFKSCKSFTMIQNTHIKDSEKINMIKLWQLNVFSGYINSNSEFHCFQTVKYLEILKKLDKNNIATAKVLQ